jgi:hypothetical protein
MKLTINYEHGTSERPFDASIKLPSGEYACASGKTPEEARTRVIERAKVKLQLLPSPEEVEL